jgi:uncharacterized membrane protein HdeD (DUF308 family)
VKDAYRGVTAIFGVLAIVIGIAIVVETAIVGGAIGYLIGILFVGLGAGRLYLLLRRE